MRNTKKPIQLYRGTTQQHSDYAGPVGEITVDTEKYTVVVQNGVTGGVPLAREDTVVFLTNRIAAEESVRATADTALRISITDEVSARKSADTALQNSVASEASARETADNALQKKVTDEASARMAADTTLQHNLTNETSARDAADITLRNNLTNEIHVRESADTALQKSITDEASARETADNALQEQIDNLLRRGAVIGEIRWFAMSTPPTGWLVCNGAAVGRATYPELFAAIGTIYGTGDGSTTFNLPNLINKFIQGSNTVGTVKSAGLPNITGSGGSFFGGGAPTSGALSKTPVTEALMSAQTQSTKAPSYSFAYLKFNASSSNNIYGNSTTVQPPALCLLPCIRYE